MQSMNMNMMPFEPMNMHPMHPMHPMNMPSHPMRHHMPSMMMNCGSPYSPMPSHPMDMPMNMMPYGEHMNTSFHPESMMHHMPSHPMRHHMPSHPMDMPMNMMMTPYSGMNTMMNPMTNWMRHVLPREVRDVAFRPMNVLEYNTFVNPIVYHPDGSRMLHLCFDVKGFKPEEVKVEVMAKERAIIVEAKHEVKDKEHNVTRHFLRKFILPEEVCCDLTKVELKSALSHDGLLVLESVLPRITPEELKTIREKTSTKSTTPYMPVAPVTHHGHHAVSVPVKMN